MTRPRSTARRAIPAAGLLAIAAFLAWRVPVGLLASVARFVEAGRAVHDGPGEALARQRGPEYAAAVAGIRERLPVDATYVLVSVPGGADMIVRFDLAPRRAVFGGSLRELGAALASGGGRDLPAWTVLADLEPPGPRLVATRDLAARRVER